MKKRKLEARALEARLRIRKNDPMADTLGGVVYSPADIKALEEEKLGGLRAHFRLKRWREEAS